MLAKHVRANYQISSFYPGGLRQIFGHFSRKFQNFVKKSSKISIFFLAREFALEISKFQNFEYEVHQSSPTDRTAEISNL
jgi:hypothetical protein